MRGQVPAKADVAAQKAFYDDISRPLMNRVKHGANEALLFMDASQRDNLSLFQKAINNLIQSATGTNRSRVAKLTGEKVQLF